MIRSLRGRLFLILVLPLIGIAAFAAVARYVAAERMSRDLYDRTLLAVALTISRDVVLTEGDLLREDLLHRLSQTLGDAIYYRVGGPDDGFVTGYSDAPDLPEGFVLEGDAPHFYDATFRDAPVRVVMLQEYLATPVVGGWVTVQVWQTVTERAALSLRLAIQAAALMAVVIVAAAAILWYGVHFGLKPLLDLREAVERRSQDDLAPIKRPVPREVKRLVGAMNALFARLQAAFAARDEFIANAAHQLRNPIAAIQAQAEAAGTAPTDREMRARVREVAEAARRTGRLTQQLLSMEKVRGRPDVATDVDIEEVAAGVMRIHAPDAMRHGAEISLEVEGPPKPVRGDPVLLAEALDNLVDNALRYGCRAGGSVRVVIRFEPDRARVVVEDDGPGVPPEARERIFERFERGAEDGPDGCGLGLAIARETMARHGGSIRLAEAPKGTRFEIDLPLATAA
jgi:two-component system, OmpR family, sensor histidine kinase TctE